MTAETVRYNFRLRPGAQAERALFAEWHRCRYLWNEAVHLQRTGRGPTRGSLGKLLTSARATNQWLRDGSQNAQAETLNTYGLALARSFTVKGCGRPIAKRRRTSRPSLAYTRNGFSIIGGRLRLPKGVVIPVVWSRDLPSVPTSVRVYQDSLGHWYASFVVHRRVVSVPAVDGSVGIDWGVSVTATASNAAYDLPYGGHRRRCAAELAKAQRRMARRWRSGKTASNGYRHAKREAAKLHKRATRQNGHAARVWAKQLVSDHQLIAVEDFRPKFLAKSTLARQASDAAISTAKRELIERAVRAGRQVVIVAPAYTTMTCSVCFARNKQRLGLAERTFRCRECGYTDSRDRNAARTILAVAERGGTSVDDVRHGSASPPGVAVLAQSELTILRL